MTEKNKLRKILNQPPTPENLEAKIRQNWQLQTQQETSISTHGKWQTPLALIASIAFVVLAIISFTQTPTVVNDAYKDMLADARHDIGLSIPLDEIIKTENINSVINDKIKMTKQCYLNGKKTIHMKISQSNEEEIHLFLYDGKFDQQLWQTHEGEIDNMPWKIVNRQNASSILVLHSKKIRPQQVDQLLHQIFSA